MKIQTRTILNISKENEGLISVVAQRLGYERWAIAMSTEEKADISVKAFIIEYLNNQALVGMKQIVIPAIDEYFGLQDKKTADYLKSQLDTALEVKTLIM